MGTATTTPSLHDHADLRGAERATVVPRPARQPAAAVSVADSDVVLGILRRMREAQREVVVDPG